MENRERIVILGAGESGTGAAILARSKGFDVFVSEAGKIKHIIKEAHSCLGMLITHDPEFVMNRFHRKEESTEQTKLPGKT